MPARVSSGRGRRRRRRGRGRRQGGGPSDEGGGKERGSHHRGEEQRQEVEAGGQGVDGQGDAAVGDHGEDGPGRGHSCLRGPAQVVDVLPPVWRQRPASVWVRGGLAAVVHHHVGEPVLRRLHPLAVQSAQGGEPHQVRQTCQRLLHPGRAGVRGPRPCLGRGRGAAGVHPHQAGESRLCAERCMLQTPVNISLTLSIMSV